MDIDLVNYIKEHLLRNKCKERKKLHMKELYEKPLEFFIDQPILIRLSTIIEKALRESSRDAESILSYLLYSGEVDSNKSRNDFYFVDLDEDHHTVVKFAGKLSTDKNFLNIGENVEEYRTALMNAYEKSTSEDVKDYIKLKLNSTYTEEYELAIWLYDANLINTDKGDRRWESEEHGIDINWGAPEHSKYLEFAKDLLEITNSAVIRDIIDKINEYKNKI